MLDGITYWLGRGQPADDDRDVSAAALRSRPPELTVLYPPPVGTVLPLTPLAPAELQAALALPDEPGTARPVRTKGAPLPVLGGSGLLLHVTTTTPWGSSVITRAPGTAALLRCLEFYGASRGRCGGVEVPLGVDAAAPRRVVTPPYGPAELALLRRAAVACVAQAARDPEFGVWVSQRALFMTRRPSSLGPALGASLGTRPGPRPA